MSPRPCHRCHSIRASRLAVALLSLLIATPAWALSAQARRGRQVLAQAQCNRCHTVTAVAARAGVPPAPRRLHCVGCHTWILDTADDDAAQARMRRTYPEWDRYLENVVHFTALPDLGTLTRRVDPAFIRRYLDAPFDLRPQMDERMIPVTLSAQEKDALVRYLTELNGEHAARITASATPSPQQIARGRALFQQRGCPTCHVVGTLNIPSGLVIPGSRLIPFGNKTVKHVLINRGLNVVVNLFDRLCVDLHVPEFAQRNRPIRFDHLVAREANGGVEMDGFDE